MKSSKKRVAKIERVSVIQERRARAEKVMNYNDENGSYFTPDEKSIIIYKKVLGYKDEDITIKCGFDARDIRVALIKYKYITDIMEKQFRNACVRK